MGRSGGGGRRHPATGHAADDFEVVDTTWAHTNVIMSRGEADTVRRDADAVVTDIDTGAFPFDRDWSTWRPDPAWPLPALPTDWAEL